MQRMPGLSATDRKPVDVGCSPTTISVMTRRITPPAVGSPDRKRPMPSRFLRSYERLSYDRARHGARANSPVTNSALGMGIRPAAVTASHGSTGRGPPGRRDVPFARAPPCNKFDINPSVNDGRMGSGRIASTSAGIPRHQLGWRMAVLPFRRVGAPAGRGIALGVAEEISAALARFRTPRLIATATFWDGSGPAADALVRCRTYQLDYIIDGTIHVVGDTVHVDVTLLDVVLDFEVIWCGRFDG